MVVGKAAPSGRVGRPAHTSGRGQRKGKAEAGSVGEAEGPSPEPRREAARTGPRSSPPRGPLPPARSSQPITVLLMKVDLIFLGLMQLLCFLGSIRDLSVSGSLPVRPLCRRTIQFITIKRHLIPLWGGVRERRAACPAHARRRGEAVRSQHLSGPTPASSEPPNDILSCRLINSPAVRQPRVAGGDDGRVCGP